MIMKWLANGDPKELELLSSLGYTNIDNALVFTSPLALMLSFGSGAWYLLRSQQPQNLEKILRERIEELSPNQHSWFEAEMAALKRSNLSPEEYGIQMLQFLAKAGKQDK